MPAATERGLDLASVHRPFARRCRACMWPAPPPESSEDLWCANGCDIDTPLPAELAPTGKGNAATPKEAVCVPEFSPSQVCAGVRVCVRDACMCARMCKHTQRTHSRDAPTA